MRFLLGFGLVCCTVVLAWPFLPRTYEASAVLVLRPAEAEVRGESQTMRQPLDESAIQSEIHGLGSTAIADRIIAEHALALDPEFSSAGKRGRLPSLRWADGAFLPSLDFSGVETAGVSHAVLRERLWNRMVVNRDRRSYTVSIGFRSSDPEKAESLTRTFVAAYLDGQVDRKRRSAAMLNASLDERVDAARERLSVSEEAYRDHLARSGLLDLGAQISLETQVAALSTELAAIRSRSFEASTRSAALAEMERTGSLDSAPEVLASAAIRSLRERMAGAMARTAVAAPELQAIAEEIRLETGRIVRAAASEVAALSAREALLRSEIINIRAALARRHEADLAVQHLRLETANDREALETALTRLKELTGELQVWPDAEVIVSPEIPRKPSAPNLPLAVVGTLLLGVLVGAALNWRMVMASVMRLLRG